MRHLLGGHNRTGVATQPELAAAMVAATRQFPPTSAGDAEAIAQERAHYARGGDVVGTMPPPVSVSELARTAVRTMIGEQPLLLLDKLGERLAFERTGTRLYDALLSKHEARRTFSGGPTRDEIIHIRDEERQHMRLVNDAIAGLGGDPTAVTPSANLHATASHGFCAVLADPRTDVQQGLEVLLAAELLDNDSWATLIELTELAGQDELAARFQKALATEREHLEQVRGWLATATGLSVERGLLTGAETRREPSTAAIRHARGRVARAAHTRATGRSAAGGPKRQSHKSHKTKPARTRATKRHARH